MTHPGDKDLPPLRLPQSLGKVGGSRETPGWDLGAGGAGARGRVSENTGLTHRSRGACCPNAQGRDTGPRGELTGGKSP